MPTTTAAASGDGLTSDGLTTSTGPGETGDETTGAQVDEAPIIVGFEVSPDLIQENVPIGLAVAAEHAQGVRMQLETGEVVELAPGQVGSFTGQIATIFTGLDNGEHIAVLTPWRAELAGESVDAPYYIALPEPGSQTYWETGDLIHSFGIVVAMGVLPDHRWVELGSYFVQGEPRCFLRVRDPNGDWAAEDFVSVLPTSHCTAIDMTVHPETGALHVLVDRKGGDGVRWWLGEIASWGKGAHNIAMGPVGDRALALARHPNMLAVCGTKKVQTGDLDAFAVLVRPGQAAEERLLDYEAKGIKKHAFWETGSFRESSGS